MKLKLLLPFLFVIYSCAQDSSIDRDDLIEKAGAPLLNGLGSHTFTISSKVEGVQDYFNQGLIMAFAFNHAESIRSFKAAQKLDPNCAICFWGEALALGPNINVTSDGKAIMSPQERLDAFERTNKAIALIELASPKEKDFILTLKSRYNGDVNSSRVPLDIAYANAMAEIDLQMKELNFIADHLFVTAANMTQAGCELGAKILNWPTRIQGVSPVYWEMNIKKDIARICNAGAKMLEVNLTFTHDMINHDNNFVGEKYGAVTEKGTQAMKLLAKKEGIILDPVYTSKGFAALISYIKKGIIKRGANVIFMFTGGSPAVFAYNEELTKKI